MPNSRLMGIRGFLMRFLAVASPKDISIPFGLNSLVKHRNNTRCKDFVYLIEPLETYCFVGISEHGYMLSTAPGYTGRLIYSLLGIS